MQYNKPMANAVYLFLPYGIADLPFIRMSRAFAPMQGYSPGRLGPIVAILAKRC
jgi:hypothetical protein